MLLRRFVEALRRQDWTTALIEFLIVVVGIFIALQVDNWAQAVAARNAEKAALERLFSEAQKANEEIQIRAERTKRINGARRSAIAFVDSIAPVPENTLPIKVGINTLSQFPQLVVVNVVYDELRSSGQLQLIRDAEIRDSLASLYASISALNQLQSGFADSSDTFWNGYRRHVIWRYNPEATDSDILLSTYDWESLRSDREFITIAIGQLRNQIVAENFLNEILTESRSACDLIAAAIGELCVDVGADDAN